MERAIDLRDETGREIDGTLFSPIKQFNKAQPEGNKIQPSQKVRDNTPNNVEY